MEDKITPNLEMTILSAPTGSYRHCLAMTAPLHLVQRHLCTSFVQGVTVCKLSLGSHLRTVVGNAMCARNAYRMIQAVFCTAHRVNTTFAAVVRLAVGAVLKVMN